MKTIKTSYKDVRVGRLCRLSQDYQVLLPSQESSNAASLPKNLLVVVLPQSGIRNNLPLDDVQNRVGGLLVNIPICNENKDFKYQTHCCYLPPKILRPTDELLINLLELDAKATEAIALTYGINTNFIDQTLGKSGVKDIISLLRKFGSAQRNFMLVRCPKCKETTHLNLAHDLRCQNGNCGYYFETSISTIRKLLPKSFKQIITDIS